MVLLELALYSNDSNVGKKRYNAVAGERLSICRTFSRACNRPNSTSSTPLHQPAAKLLAGSTFVYTWLLYSDMVVATYFLPIEEGESLPQPCVSTGIAIRFPWRDVRNGQKAVSTNTSDNLDGALSVAL